MAFEFSALAVAAALDNIYYYVRYRPHFMFSGAKRLLNHRGNSNFKDAAVLKNQNIIKIKQRAANAQNQKEGQD